jgi:hypothetical protein
MRTYNHIRYYFHIWKWTYNPSDASTTSDDHTYTATPAYAKSST